MLEYILFSIIILLFIVGGSYSSSKANKKFELEYSSFLSKNEGIELRAVPNY